MSKKTHSPETMDSSNGGSVPDTNYQKLGNDLHAEIEAKQRRILQVSKTFVPSSSVHDRINSITQCAQFLRDQCRDSKASLRSASNGYKELRSTWSKLAARRKFLLEMKATIMHIKSIQLVAKAVDDGLEQNDAGKVTDASFKFESLNATAPVRMDQRYTCLRPLAGSVALAVAGSMQMLRSSLRKSCLRFDPVGYAKCISDFNHFGASSQFLSYVFHIFAEEAKQIFEMALLVEAKACQKAEFFFSRMQSLLVQFSSVLHFPADFPYDEQEARIWWRCWEGSNQSSFPGPPFQQFSALAAGLLSHLKPELLREKCSSFLNVADAAKSLLEKLTDARLAFESLRLSKREERVVRSQPDKPNPDVILLKGGAVIMNPGGRKAVRRRNSLTRIEAVEAMKTLSTAIQDMGMEWLADRHICRVEELLLNTNTPESWIRIKLPERELFVLLKNAFEGVGGRLGRKRKNYRDSQNPDEPFASIMSECISPAVVTFTPASTGILRWVSEYSTIAIAIAGILPDAVGAISDVFLTQVHSSVALNDSIHASRSKPLLKSVKDLVLEMPKEKAISDFINPAVKEVYKAFAKKYNTQRVTPSDSKRQFQMRSPTAENCSQRYNYGGSALLSKPWGHSGLVTLQCVAAEEIGTLCHIVRRFANLIGSLSTHYTNLREYGGNLQLASLRSALSIGTEVQTAIYKLLAWDIIGGWDAISTVAATCRSFHQHGGVEMDETASTASPFVTEMVSRIECGYSDVSLPPKAAEKLAFAVCEAGMDTVLEGFSRVQHCSHTAAASQMLLDIRTLDLALVEHTGIHPCPGQMRTEMYVKATFLEEAELKQWIDRHKRKFGLSKAHLDALLLGCRRHEIPVVDQIITL